MGFIYYRGSALLLLLLLFFFPPMRSLAEQIVTICWQTSKWLTRDLFLMQIYRNANRRMIQLYASLLKPINAINLLV